MAFSHPWAAAFRRATTLLFVADPPALVDLDLVLCASLFQRVLVRLVRVTGSPARLSLAKSHERGRLLKTIDYVARARGWGVD